MLRRYFLFDLTENANINIYRYGYEARDVKTEYPENQKTGGGDGLLPGRVYSSYDGLHDFFCCHHTGSFRRHGRFRQGCHRIRAYARWLPLSSLFPSCSLSHFLSLSADFSGRLQKAH